MCLLSKRYFFLVVSNCKDFNVVPSQLQYILKQTNLFGPYDIPTVVAKLQHHGISIGVKKLLDLLDMVKQMGEQSRVIKFISKLEEEHLAVLRT